MMEEWRVARPEGERAKRCELAAFLQAVAVVFASLALSDPAWLLVRVDGEESVYGVSYFLHHGFSLNFTRPGSPQLLHRTGLYLLALITLCCYINILIGSVAFMFDFVAACSRGILGMKVSSALHVITVVSSASSVALCSYLYVLLRHEVDSLVFRPPATNFVRLGDSYYFAVSAFLASLCAALRSCYYARKYRHQDRSEDPASQSQATTPLLQDPETSDTPGEYG